jgi:hypothetical protein
VTASRFALDAEMSRTNSLSLATALSLCDRAGFGPA